MSFNNLNRDELLKVAEFFTVDVKAANEENGPTKKEIVAALAEGDNPVTWDDYKNVYLKSDVKREEDKEVAKQEAAKEEKSAESKEEKSEEAEPVAEEKLVLLKYERKNPTWQVGPYTFTKAHPFKAVPEKVAENLVKNQKGFRVALPSEATDYYS